MHARKQKAIELCTICLINLDKVVGWEKSGCYIFEIVVLLFWDYYKILGINFLTRFLMKCPYQFIFIIFSYL